MRPALVVLGCAVGVVMLIVCANLSNLLLARTAARQKEIAIRTALGAGRGRLIAPDADGKRRAVLLRRGARAAPRGRRHARARRTSTRSASRCSRASALDATRARFTLAMALVDRLVFGLAPALQTPAAALHDALKDASRGSTEGRRADWMRNALVVSEIAFACVLLVGAGPADSKLPAGARRQSGFPAGASGRDARRSGRRFHDAGAAERLLRRGAAPRQASARHRGGRASPTRCRSDATAAGAPGARGTRIRTRPVSRRVRAHRQRRLLAAMGIPLRAGRDISPAGHASERAGHRDQRDDGADAVAGPGSDRQDRPAAVGGAARRRRRRRRAPPRARAGLGQRDVPADAADAAIYRRSIWWSASTLPPAQLRLDGARRARSRSRRTCPATSSGRLQQLVDKSVSPRRFVVLLLGGFAVFALVLASLGIYALISYSVSQRTQEIGIRMALGASARDVQPRIVLQTLRLAAIGMRLGRRGVVGARALAQRVALRRDRDRPGDVCRRCCCSAAVAAAGGLSAGAPRVAHRSDGRAACR